MRAPPRQEQAVDQPEATRSRPGGWSTSSAIKRAWCAARSRLLHQHEFDALVSYAYNPGGGWRKTINLLKDHKASEAMVELSKHVTSKGQRIQSRGTPRCGDSHFLYGEYR